MSDISRDPMLYGECLHLSVTRPRARIVAGGATQYWSQCLSCGRAIGKAVSREAAMARSENRPLAFDEMLLKEVRDRYEAALHESVAKEKRAWWEWYNEYLSSEEWKAKRSAVLQRCHYRCEGCAQADAYIVHHLSYDHVGNELLYELVGLCAACHDRSHVRSERAPTSFWPGPNDGTPATPANSGAETA